MDDGFGRDPSSLPNSNILLRKLLDPDLQDGKSMYFDSKLAPELYADPPYRRPYMKSLTSVDAVRLPCETSAKNRICLVNIPLVGLDRNEKTHKEVETFLKQVPDLKGQKTFDWARRRVVKVQYMSDDFVMYMCLNKDASLPLNQSLKNSSKSSAPDFYGDAYIFRMHSGSGYAPTSSSAKYHHVGKDIITDGGQIDNLGSHILEKVFDEIRFIPEY